jgi:indolepyruvate decarboxylase
MAETVIRYVLRRLNEIGVDDVFGVAGDYAFPVNDAIVEHPAINWIGCCNELNAAYAADGYARVRGVGAVCTTNGVGELAAISAIAGSYAERLAVFHLIGAPNLPTQEGRALVHHTLGDGEFDLFGRMAEAVVCASAIMTPQNAASETERLMPRPSIVDGPSTWRYPATSRTSPSSRRRRRPTLRPVIRSRWPPRPTP